MLLEWTDSHTQRALQFWTEYQNQHDLSGHFGQAVGIDPETGLIRFGDSAKDIWEQLEKEGTFKLMLYTRVGRDYYNRRA